MATATESVGDRLRRLRLAKDMTQEQLASAVGWENAQGRIGNYERGERQLGRDEAEKVARALGVSPAELLFGNEPAQPSPTYGEGDGIRRLVPLISWVRAGSWTEVADPYSPGQAEDWLPIPKRAGPRTFALRVRGISMEPRYHDGEIIFVDPDATPRNGSRIVVRLEEGKEATFKELVVEGDRRYLRALNPAWPERMIEVAREATICGVVVGKWVDE